MYDDTAPVIRDVHIGTANVNVNVAFARVLAWCFFAGLLGGGIGTSLAVFALHAVGRL